VSRVMGVWRRINLKSPGLDQESVPLPGGPGSPMDLSSAGEVPPEAELHQQAEHHHRNVQGGAARAAVFGMSDGLLTNVSLILGIVGAEPGPSYVRLAGVAGLLAGAFSMSAGEYVSMSAQKELLGRELDVERQALRLDPKAELDELAQVYQKRGLPPGTAIQLARTLMRTPELALETHAREELGVSPSSIPSPYPAAASSFASFAVGAAVPLAPWFFLSGAPAVATSAGLVAVASVVIGLVLARATGRSPARSALRQLSVTVLAAGVTYLVGRLVGVGIVH